jgi:SAM-dependent methyltransferase
VETATVSVRGWLAHPLASDVCVDDVEGTARHRAIIAQKPFLRRLYEEWYSRIAAAVPAGDRPALEIGSGAGFLARHVANLVTSELVAMPGVAVALDARRLPFRQATLRAIVMTNVLHHIAHPRAFLAEAARVVHPGGVVVMLEPWRSRWSQLIYRSLHAEPFEPSATRWEFAEGGRLSAANGALPWIIFERDRQLFEREFPCWRIESIDLEVGMPFRYLLSGGVSLRSLTPAATFGAWRLIERALSPWMTSWAMFAIIRLRRVG